MPTYLNNNQLSNTHHVEVRTINTTDSAAVDGSCPLTIIMEQQINVCDANLQKGLLSEFKWDYKIKSQEFSKFLPNKKALIAIIFGQCDKARKTKTTLGTNYAANCQAGRLIEFLNQLHTVLFDSNDGGLSYAPYKQVLAMKSLKNFSKNKPHDPHG